jgi:CRISPR-associated protein (TIGR02584 family)
MKTSKTKATSAAVGKKAPPGVVRKDEQLILLAVTGMTPAVLTETVWALAQERPRSIPDRVVAITTAPGKELLERELYTPVALGNECLWQLLRREILGPACEKSKQLNLEIVVITAPNPRLGRSEPLDDFRTAAENAAMADFLLAQVRALVDTPGVRLIASIAGGRKTLGALLYACMSLLGRETDRLTHVLVTEPYDSFFLKPRFFFPSQPIQPLATPEGKTVAAQDAHIDLGDIPFVPLRNLFESEKIRKPCSFMELVDRCKEEVGKAARRNVQLTVWRSEKVIEVNDVKIVTSAMQQVLMLFLADPAAATARAKVSCYSDATDLLRSYADSLRAQKPPNKEGDWRSLAIVPANFAPENITKLLNELKGKLEEAGPDAVPLHPLLPKRGRFSLDLSPSAIRILD